MPRPSALLLCVLPLAAGCGGGLLVPVPSSSALAPMQPVARPGSRAKGDGARRAFRGPPAEVKAAIAAEWRKVPELTVSEPGDALLAEQRGSGFSMTMTAYFAPAGEGETEVELLIALSYTLALDRLQEMESKHLEKLAADTGR